MVIPSFTRPIWPLKTEPIKYRWWWDLPPASPTRGPIKKGGRDWQSWTNLIFCLLKTEDCDRWKKESSSSSWQYWSTSNGRQVQNLYILSVTTIQTKLRSRPPWNGLHGIRGLERKLRKCTGGRMTSCQPDMKGAAQLLQLQYSSYLFLMKHVAPPRRLVQMVVLWVIKAGRMSNLKNVSCHPHTMIHLSWEGFQPLNDSLIKGQSGNQLSLMALALQLQVTFQWQLFWFGFKHVNEMKSRNRALPLITEVGPLPRRGVMKLGKLINLPSQVCANQLRLTEMDWGQPTHRV